MRIKLKEFEAGGVYRCNISAASFSNFELQYTRKKHVNLITRYIFPEKHGGMKIKSFQRMSKKKFKDLCERGWINVMEKLN